MQGPITVRSTAVGLYGIRSCHRALYVLLRTGLCCIKSDVLSHINPDASSPSVLSWHQSCLPPFSLFYASLCNPPTTSNFFFLNHPAPTNISPLPLPDPFPN